MPRSCRGANSMLNMAEKKPVEPEPVCTGVGSKAIFVLVDVNLPLHRFDAPVSMLS